MSSLFPFFFFFFFLRLNKASSTSLEHHMYRLLRRIEPVKGEEGSNIVKVIKRLIIKENIELR